MSDALTVIVVLFLAAVSFAAITVNWPKPPQP